MRVREWIVLNTATHGDPEKPYKIYTSPDASRDVAYRKLAFRFRSNLDMLCFVGLKKGGVINLNGESFDGFYV